MLQANRRLRVLLIQPPTPFLEDPILEAPLGLLYIGAVLKQAGISVAVLDLAGDDPQHIAERIKGQSVYPDIVGISTYTPSFIYAIEIVEIIRRLFPHALIVAGGPHATALPTQVSEYFDSVVVGEGENAMLRICESVIQRQSVPKIYLGEPITDLNSLPFPAYDLVKVPEYTRTIKGRKCASVLTSRGCTHACAFCNSRVFARGKRFLRLRFPHNVAQEIWHLKNNYGIESIRFQDDMFTISFKRCKQIMELSPPIVYTCFSRADTLSKDMCLLLKDTGCSMIKVGVESGSRDILRRMRKGLTPEQIRSGLHNAHVYGLKIRIYLIVGFPGETDATIKETLDFLDTVSFDEFLVYPAIPYPGTPLYHDRERFGITWIDEDYKKYVQVGRQRLTGFVMATNEFSPETVMQWRDTVIQHLESKERQWYTERRSDNA